MTWFLNKETKNLDNTGIKLTESARVSDRLSPQGSERLPTMVMIDVNNTI